VKTENIVKQKSLDFALRIVRMSRYLISRMSYTEHPICTQVLRSGTSIGANVREAEHAESKEDFIHKMKIALKEANETEYWLELLYRSDILSEDEYQSINADCTELNKLLIAIVNTTKNK
jgi:four helix bundle protein